MKELMAMPITSQNFFGIGLLLDAFLPELWRFEQLEKAETGWEEKEKSWEKKMGDCSYIGKYGFVKFQFVSCCCDTSSVRSQHHSGMPIQKFKSVEKARTERQQ